MAVIYRILNVANDCFYIGSAVNPRRRKWEHWSSLKKGSHHCAALQKAWDDFGEDAFEFEIIQTVDEEEDLLLTEDTFLLKYAGQPDCYNTATSTQFPSSSTPAVRKKISVSLKEKYSGGEYTPRVGKNHSEETKRLISQMVRRAVARGKGGKFIPSEETRQKMSEALKGNQCAAGYKRTDQEKEAIRQRMLGNQNWLGKTHTEESKAKMSRAVVAISPEGQETTYVSITALRKEMELTPPTVDRALKSGKPLTKGKCAGWSFKYLAPNPKEQ